ncbi:DUF3180 domain-containing protein [Streptomyces sp. ACA25]|uniref:DUF3180 domain-containing protein n=1 Tax=Streptomyces sp. ACA25 TaxID=3022596 RepID=UPI002307BFE0|nr:DUF3180 domain-containing protein [Streptomyces sp. ACA25]MDB1086647.1 DUF3180 domain-containing protein [Streptomyces sp. ACA25]
MTHLRIRTLAGLFAASVALAWAGAGLWDSVGTLPAVPVLAPVVLALIAAALLATALSVRSRLRAQRERRPDARGVDPITATRALLFGQACALVSAVAAGMYGGTALFLLQELWDVPNRRDQGMYAGLAVLAGLAVCAAAVFLERVCRLPEDDEDGPLGEAL